MPQNYSIYKITNIINGKSYIGQTCRKIKRRFGEHCSRAKTGYKNPLYVEMREYGEDNFKISLLESNIPKEKIDDREQYWIKKYGSLSPNGYNHQSGGRTHYYDRFRVGRSIHGDIHMYDLQTGKELNIFRGLMDAERYLRDNGHPKASHSAILNCCLGRTVHAYKYVWRFNGDQYNYGYLI